MADLPAGIFIQSNWAELYPFRQNTGREQSTLCPVEQGAAKITHIFRQHRKH
jgi:hypothetical protein